MEIKSVGRSAFEIGRIVLVALIVALAAQLLFAFLVRAFSFSSAVIKPVNQVIKVISILVGVFCSGSKDHGLIKGAIGGGLAILVTWFVFAFLAGGSELTVMLLVELLFGVLVGGISGILFMNFRK